MAASGVNSSTRTVITSIPTGADGPRANPLNEKVSDAQIHQRPGEDPDLPGPRIVHPRNEND